MLIVSKKRNNWFKIHEIHSCLGVIYLAPHELQNVEEIIDQLRPHIRDISTQTYYRKQGNSCTTYCMMRCFPATGEFELLTDRKYLTSDAYLRRGDILVSSGHTVMALENGEKEDDDMDKATFTELFREMRKDLQDNDCSDWSEAARQWAVNNGIVQGGAPLPDGSANFMWQDMMTREQLVTVLYRFAQKLGMI